MKVFDLRCASDHRFEGWIGSDADYESQHAKRMIGCPICGSDEIGKLPSAPRLNLSGATAPVTRREGEREGRDGRDAKDDRGTRETEAERADAAGGSAGGPGKAGVPALPPEAMRELQRQYMLAARELIAKTENVGDRFAEEARKIHYDEAPARGIRGIASAEQTRELIEEGIDVLALPIPAALEGPLQ